MPKIIINELDTKYRNYDSHDLNRLILHFECVTTLTISKHHCTKHTVPKIQSQCIKKTIYFVQLYIDVLRASDLGTTMSYQALLCVCTEKL